MSGATPDRGICPNCHGTGRGKQKSVGCSHCLGTGVVTIPALPSTALWCVNIHGPDDVIAVVDYLTAIKVANAFNAWWQRQEFRANDPHMWAVPIEWPYSEASHAESLADTSGEYAGFIAYVCLTQEGLKSIGAVGGEDAA